MMHSAAGRMLVGKVAAPLCRALRLCPAGAQKARRRPDFGVGKRCCATLPASPEGGRRPTRHRACVASECRSRDAKRGGRSHMSLRPEYSWAARGSVPPVGASTEGGKRPTVGERSEHGARQCPRRRLSDRICGFPTPSKGFVNSLCGGGSESGRPPFFCQCYKYAQRCYIFPKFPALARFWPRLSSCCPVWYCKL